jgi:ADP-heptose:LPS heptosyltransferase
VEAGRILAESFGYSLLLTGSAKESTLTERMASDIGENAISLAGKISLGEFLLLINKALVVVSVNTASVHIAAALHTPVVVLYALTNPQHAPWRGLGKLLLFDVPEEQRSKNEVLNFVRDICYPDGTSDSDASDIVEAVKDILVHGNCEPFPSVVIAKRDDVAQMKNVLNLIEP